MGVHITFIRSLMDFLSSDINWTRSNICPRSSWHAVNLRHFAYKSRCYHSNFLWIYDWQKLVTWIQLYIARIYTIGKSLLQGSNFILPEYIRSAKGLVYGSSIYIARIISDLWNMYIDNLHIIQFYNTFKQDYTSASYTHIVRFSWYNWWY